MKLVEDICPLPEVGYNPTLSLPLPITFRLRIISSMVVIAPQGEATSVCCCYCWCGTSCYNFCIQTHRQCAVKSCAGYALAKT